MTQIASFLRRRDRFLLSKNDTQMLKLEQLSQLKFEVIPKVSYQRTDSIRVLALPLSKVSVHRIASHNSSYSDPNKSLFFAVQAFIPL